MMTDSFYNAAALMLNRGARLDRKRPALLVSAKYEVLSQPETVKVDAAEKRGVASETLAVQSS